MKKHRLTLKQLERVCARYIEDNSMLTGHLHGAVAAGLMTQAQAIDAARSNRPPPLDLAALVFEVHDHVYWCAERELAIDRQFLDADGDEAAK